MNLTEALNSAAYSRPRGTSRVSEEHGEIMLGDRKDASGTEGRVSIGAQALKINREN
jgi:hypothetical protein